MKQLYQYFVPKNISICIEREIFVIFSGFLSFTVFETVATSFTTTTKTTPTSITTKKYTQNYFNVIILSFFIQKALLYVVVAAVAYFRENTRLFISNKRHMSFCLLWSHNKYKTTFINENGKLFVIQYSGIF